VNVKAYIMVVAAAALVAGAASLAQEGAEAKEAAAEKKGEALKLERAAELEKMRELENVSPTLAVAVKSCVMAPIADPKKKGKEKAPVDVGGDDWGELAWSFGRAVGREMTESHEGVPPDMAKAGEGKVYVHVAVLVKNLSDKTQLVLPADFTLQTPEGYAASYNVKTLATADPFDGIYLPPGASSGGKLVFVLPPRDEYTLHYYNPQTKVAGTKRVLVMRGD
jgi:hypothetical protein